MEPQGSFVMSQLSGQQRGPQTDDRNISSYSFTTNPINNVPYVNTSESQPTRSASVHDFRQLNDDNESDAEEECSNIDDSSKKPSQKTNYACTECRKAHKACSGQRPCERCVKFGIGETCSSSTRKRRSLTKKYWVDFLQQQQLQQQIQQQCTAQKQPIFVDHFEMERMKSAILKQKTKVRSSLQNWTIHSSESYQHTQTPPEQRQHSPVKDNTPTFGPIGTPRPLEPQYSPRVDHSPRLQTTPYSTPRLEHSPRLQQTPRSAPYPSPRSSPRYNPIPENVEHISDSMHTPYHSPRLGGVYSPRSSPRLDSSPRLSEPSHYSPRADYSPRIEAPHHPVQYSPRVEQYHTGMAREQYSPRLNPNALPSISEELLRLESISELTKNMNIREGAGPTFAKRQSLNQTQIYQGQTSPIWRQPPNI
ncbi:transcription activator of gluconeogenesis [Acrasis kona]|uniref:Transcription activator of gluconeogenesis n=1 Tax=Acrasis kona TaxID=1008807 RepID=A0AAW2ZGZ5_9EUKA